jgi:DDE family transposase
MAFIFTKSWDAAIAKNVRDFYDTLSEKEQRRFAAVQARQLGYGSVKYIAKLLGCSRRTIERGLAELDKLPNDPAAGQVRRPGAGRKKKLLPDSPVEQHLKSVLETRTAGDPDDATLVFTDRSPALLSVTMAKMGTPVCAEVIRHWMEEHDLRLRKIAKDLAGGHSPDRDAQFERIAALIAAYEEAGNPYFSIDTKAKEHLGKLFRAGRVRSTQAFHAFDHDFPSWADGVLIPHGLYDRVRNRGHINLGLSHDTSQFACDSFRWYWNRSGKRCYPEATSILWLCDCGGSNAANQYLFKHDVQLLADHIGVEIRVAHYPSYCSKYNVIERRLFPHITRACQGMLFDKLDTVVTLMRKASTSTGLRTTVNVIRRHYETGRNATEHMKQNLKIVFDNLLPKWNYRAIPQHATVIN